MNQTNSPLCTFAILVCPLRMTAGRDPFSENKRMFLSVQAVASHFPSGENEHQFTSAGWEKTRRCSSILSPLNNHTTAFPSSPHDAKNCPSLENFEHSTFKRERERWAYGNLLWGITNLGGESPLLVSRNDDYSGEVSCKLGRTTSAHFRHRWRTQCIGRKGNTHSW